MKGSLVKLIIVTVGVSLTAASVYTAFTLSGQPQVYNYIPENSTLVSHFSYGNGTYYLFATNSSYGLITETPVWQVEGAITHARGNNTTTSNITVTTAMSYQGYSIFKFTGIGLPELMSVLGMKSSSNNITLPVGELSVYATELTQQYSIIGSLSGVLSSINSSLHNTGFKNLNTYIDEGIPFSTTFFAGHGSQVSSISINVTTKATFVTVTSSNPMPLPMVLNISSFMVGVKDLSNQSVTFVIGVGWTQIQALLGDIINSISQYGGLNVKNYTGIPVLF